MTNNTQSSGTSLPGGGVCFPIRHLAESADSHTVAAAEFEHRVHLFNADTYAWKQTLETVMDFGGLRLALNDTGAICFTAAYYVHGVVAYSSEGGTILWQRADLKKVQRLLFDESRQELLCGFSEKAFHVLDPQSGKTVKSLRGVRRGYRTPGGSRCLLTSKGKGVVTGGRVPIPLDLKDAGILDAAFTEIEVAVSQVAGPVRCFSIDSGESCWRYDPPGGHHVLDLAADWAKGCFYGIQWFYQKAGPYGLLRFDPETGVPTLVREIDSRWKPFFFRKGTRILLSDGEVLRTEDGMWDGRLKT